MITVRFPNGQAVQYNDGNYVVRHNTYHMIYTKENGKLLAMASSDCIIEWVRPCYITNPIDKSSLDILYRLDDLQRQIKLLRKELKK